MGIKTNRYYGSATETIKRLKLSRMTFTVVRTSKTTNVKTEKVNYLFAEKHYFGQIFGLLAELKRQLDNNAQLITDCPFSGEHKTIKYFQFSRSLKNYYADSGIVYDIPNVIEADITKAYYSALLILGFINAEFYARCIKLSKIDRLILVGSIATVKTIEHYQDGMLLGCSIDKNDLYRMAWFKICSYVDSALLSLKERFDQISPDIFLFYWVDGIYFREFEVPNTGYGYKKVFEELKMLFGFDWEIQKLKRLQLLNTGTHLKIRLTKQNGTKKTFFPNRSEIKLYYLDKDGKPVDVWTDLFTNTLKFK